MRINNQSIYFKSWTNSTNTTDSSIEKKRLIHTTYLFRDCPTLDFMTEYILKNFPSGTHIADFGCSNGEETYSIATMLAKNNRNLKYKITGYDLSAEAINEAKKGAYEFDHTDLALIEPKKYPGLENYYVFDERIAKYIDIFKKAFDIRVHKYYDCWEYDTKCTIKPGIVKDSVDFKVANILDLGTKKLDLPPNTNVIIFKNAWYHLAPKAVDEAIEKIYQALPPKGLLVVGTLGDDHTIDGREPLSKFPLAKKLKAAGFRPVFYSTNCYGLGMNRQTGLKNEERYDIPSVFMKV
jgi:chemotaxis methyl-accepting protein methylase